jgi:hypothetical protein
MRKWILCVSLASMVSTGPAKGAGGAEALTQELERERQLIEAARKAKMADLATQDAACLSRFAVTDCQNQVGKQRRAMLADLKRQEAHLNEVDRRQKGAEQIQSGQNKAIEKTRRQSEAQVSLDSATQEERQSAMDEKLLNHKRQAKTSAPATPARKGSSGPDAVTIESNRAAFAEKQNAAERRRLDREKRLLDKASGSMPLPRNP